MGQQEGVLELKGLQKQDGIYFQAQSDQLEGQEKWQKEIYDGRKDIYAEFTPEALPNKHGHPEILLTWRRHHKLIKKMRPKPGQKVLDIGCNIGLNLELMRTIADVDGFGLDISREALMKAKELCNSKFDFVKTTAEGRLPFKDESFDIATSFDVLEHLAKPELIIAEAFRILRPGGKFLVHIPVKDYKGSYDWIYQLMNPQKFDEGMKVAGHDLNVMKTRKEYEGIFTGAGFKLFHSQRYNVLLQNIFDYHIHHRILNRLFHVYGLPFTLFHTLVAPLIELMTLPDRLLGFFDIGASIYIIGEKPVTTNS